MMKRVLHVVGGMGLGGAETYLMNIYRNIDRSKLQFDFLTYYKDEQKGYYDNEINELGGKIINLKSPSVFCFVRAVKDIQKVLQSCDYAALHCHTMFNSGFAILAGKLENIPIRITHSHNTAIGGNPNIIDKIYQATMKIIINKYSTHFLGCSKKAAEFLFSKKNVERYYKFMPNAVNFEPFLSIDESFVKTKKNELNIPQNSKVIGHVGRYGKQKNHEFIIKVFEKLCETNNNTYLILIGDGPTRGKIEEDIKIRGIQNKVRVLGQRSDIPELMSIMDLFLFPSLFEGLGIVLLEAQVSRLPCIVSEHIQPEADLGLNLLHKISLHSPISEWVSIIEKHLYQNKMNKIRIRETLSNSPYILNNVVNEFYKLYGI